MRNSVCLDNSKSEGDGGGGRGEKAFHIIAHYNKNNT
jgi:hypothetical protein